MEVLVWLGIAALILLFGLISSCIKRNEEIQHLNFRNAKILEENEYLNAQNTKIIEELAEYKKKLTECQIKLNVFEKNEQKNQLLSVQNIEYKKLVECQIKLNALEKNEQKRRNFHDEIMEKIKTLFKERQNACMWLAGMMTDFLTIAEEEYQKSLENTGKKAQLERAFKINDLRKEIRRLIRENKILKYEMDYVKALIPETEDIIEYNELGEKYSDNYQNEDFISAYLPKEEYSKLTETEKNKRALEYYINRKKSNWEIGRDFEMFIGYQFEKKGYRVQYFGIEKKLNDLGRDLIVESNRIINIVQCKYWSKEKTIHEKHIMQLYGTTIKYILDHPGEKRQVGALFITHTTISNTAREFARVFRIRVIENVELGKYPLIKCNVRRSGYDQTSYIYHLPFDQQYDIVKINKKEGDFYAFTIEEAEAAGFKRAHRWHGSL
jgi:hypothetical protein